MTGHASAQVRQTRICLFKRGRMAIHASHARLLVFVVIELDGLLDRRIDPTRQREQASDKKKRHPEKEESI